MAKLAALRQNNALLRAGDWVDLGPDWDDLRLRVRGQGPRYHDARARLIARAAKDHGDDETQIPDDQLNLITAQAAADHLLLDVDGLEDGDQRVTVDRYRQLMLDPDYLTLVSAVLVASDRLARRARQEARDAEGNSGPPSAGG